ncbi:MAG TPA: hypothetical protein PLU30_06820 [Verrucomicrobiae bacterium]|nr:hypothetical protein [Verrucomicrobiae bacterium]
MSPGVTYRVLELRRRALLCMMAATVPWIVSAEGKERRLTPNERLERVLSDTRPLEVPRGRRFPVIVWPLQGVSAEDDDGMARIIRQLDVRGLATVGAWDYARRDKALPAALRLARLQKSLGIEIVVNTTGVMETFFDGDPSTAHVADDGRPFFDDSFSPRVKIGCPFALRHRYSAIRAQVETFARAYADAGLAPDIAIADWEIDGPIEWNRAWENCRRCRRCRENIPGIADFPKFQAALRTIRSEMQRLCYAEPMKGLFPQVRVGNYAVYPHDGYRYWHDYFEEDFAGESAKADDRARYRPWFDEFVPTGYNLAVPVVYTWYRTFGWYDFADPDYRWFYNLLLVATNAGRSAPVGVPVISFVHWHTTSPPGKPDASVRQMGEGAYQEILWHMLLRGHDGFAMWCPPDEIGQETRLVQEVFAESLKYNDFILEGEPVLFDVPKSPTSVISALRVGDRLLVRRTDFAEGPEEVVMDIGGSRVRVPRSPGKCQVVQMGER